MKTKKRWFVQFFLKGGDTFYFYSFSKRRALKRVDSWFDFFGDDVLCVSSNFVLK